MEEWKEYKLGDVCIMKNGRKRPIDEGEYPVYGGNGIMGYSNQYNTEDTIIVGRVGAYCGNVFLSKNKCWVSDNAISVVAKNQVHTDFLYYLMLTLDLHNQHIGAAQPLMTQDIIGRFEVKIPSLSTQLHIADILISLDDKIEVNRKINSNLEEQAKALFKSWFIDFEPFKGGKFDDSELGKIPEGWEVRRLDEVSKIVGGGTPSKSKPQYFSHNGIHWITPKDLSLSHAKFTSSGADDITIEGYNNSSARLMPKGTVLFSSRAPIGYISIALNELCTNQGFKSVVPQELNTIYLYYYIKFHVKDIEAKASGSTFKEVSGSLMKSIPIIVPSANAVDKFENVLTPIFNYQAHIEKENSQLSSLRDTLLPKLMSGEIDVEHSKLLFI